MRLRIHCPYQLTKVLIEGSEKEFKIGIKLCQFILFLQSGKMEGVAQLVRASVCGTEGRGFETPRSPTIKPISGPYRFLNFIA